MSLRLVLAAHLTAVALLPVAAAHGAGTGVLHRPFGVDGMSVLNGTSGQQRVETDQVLDAVERPGGGMFVLGRYSIVHALLANGRLDRQWGIEGARATGIGDRNQQEATRLHALPDGGVLVFGAGIGGQPTVARLDPRGAFVPTFGNGGIAQQEAYYSNGPATAIPGTLISGDTLYIPVGVQTYTGIAHITIAAFSISTGRPVTGFGTAGVLRVDGLAGGSMAIGLGTDGRFTVVTGRPARGGNGVLTRIAPNGAIELQRLPFGGDAVLDDGVGFAVVDGTRIHQVETDGRTLPASAAVPRITRISTVRRQPDGRLLIGGLLQRASPRNNRLVVARLDPSGLPDHRWWTDGVRVLTFPRARVGQRIGALLGPTGPGRLITAVGTSGDGYNDIREDMGPTFLAALRLRGRAPVVEVLSTVARRTPGGRAVVRVRCRFVEPCPTATITARHGGVRISRTTVAGLPSTGVSRRIGLRLGDRGRRVAARRGSIELEVSAGGDRVRTRLRLRPH